MRGTWRCGTSCRPSALTSARLPRRLRKGCPRPSGFSSASTDPTARAEPEASSGFRRQRLLRIFAKIDDQAARTLGLARLADVTPVQDQPMVRVALELVRCHAHELVFDGAHGGAYAQADSIRDA